MARPPLQLARVNAADGAPDGFRHVGAGVQTQHQDAGLKGGDVQAEERHGAIEDDHGLHHHGGTAEDLHVQRHDELHQLGQNFGRNGGVLIHLDALDDAHGKAQGTTENRAQQGDLQGDASTSQEVAAVLLQQQGHPAEKCSRILLHALSLLEKLVCG